MTVRYSKLFITYFIFLSACIGGGATASAQEVFTAETQSKSHIYVIVDPHGDPAGQLELGKMLADLAEKQNVSWVGLEAATGDVSLSFLRPTAPLARRMSTAARYLKSSHLHGAEWATLGDGKEFDLWGVENPALYERTIQLYRRVAILRSESFRQLSNARKTIEMTRGTVSGLEDTRRILRIRRLTNLAENFLRSPWAYFENSAFMDAMSRRYYTRLTRDVNRILRDRFPNRTELLMSGRAMQDLLITLREFDDLYRQRNREFVFRTLEEMSRKSVTDAALVIGSIHVPQTVRLFEERGIVCTVVRPRGSERVNAYRYERLLIQQPLISDGSKMALGSISRLTLRLPQATLLRPLITQVPAMLQQNRKPMLYRFAEALGPDALRAAQDRVRQGIGEGLLADSLNDEKSGKPSSQTAAAADASGYTAFKTHVSDLEKLKDSQTDPRSLAKGIYESLAQYARSLREAALLHRPEFHEQAPKGSSFRSDAQTRPSTQTEVRMDASDWGRALQFLHANTTASHLPLSYRAPEHYWDDPTHDLSNVIDGVIERQIVANTVNIYDAAVWQIALRLDGTAKSRYLAGDFTRRLMRGSSGSLHDIRAWEDPYRYGDERVKIQRNNAFIFRTIADTWFQADPKDGKQYLPGFPNSDRLHHEDWKPITGEQAWAGIIGPLQSSYMKNHGRIPLSSNEAQIALNLLPAIEAMQSPIGAIYHAPWGTHSKDPRDISNENNFSMLAALRMLRQAVTEGGNWHEAARVQWLIEGIEAYFKEYAFDAENGVFFQGGFFMQGEFVPNPVFAVDCQTWGIAVLGPEWIDRNFGAGTAHRIWQNTKERSGVYDSDGRLEGVGFTDSRDVVSVEWTAGAILCSKLLAEHYRSSRPGWSQTLLAEARSMRAAMEQFKTQLPDGSEAYFYANRRFFIPFGWWANPIPSLVSTSWIMLLDRDFNPFILGGGKSAASAGASVSAAAPVFASSDAAGVSADSASAPAHASGSLTASDTTRLVMNVFMPADNVLSRAKSVRLRCLGDVRGDLPGELIVKDEQGREILRKTIQWNPRGKNWESQPIKDFWLMRDIFAQGEGYQLLLYAATLDPEATPKMLWQVLVDSDQIAGA